jgi:predicted DNA-binding protein
MAKARKNMRGRREMASIYLEPEVMDELRALSKRTDTTIAHYLRQAVDDLLAKLRRTKR